MYRAIEKYLVLALLVAVPASSQETEPGAAISGLADEILLSLRDVRLHDLAVDALNRNPGVAAAVARARATERRAGRVRGLPDPRLGVTAYLESPETRTGPQILSGSLSQDLPWKGKRGLRENVVLAEAAELGHEVESARLRLLTEVRRLYYELAFLDRYKEITLDFEDHLRQHEEISQARYATGKGSSQDVVRIQAEITRAQSSVLDIDNRRVGVAARLNALRDRPASAVLLPGILPLDGAVEMDAAVLAATATTVRPEIAAADARIEKAVALGSLAEKEFRPDFRVGATYTWVEPRSDTAGLLLPPEGNGDDIFGIQGGLSIPVWRKKRDAAVAEAGELELAAREAKREIEAGIRSRVEDQLQRIPLTWRQLRLFEDILIVQAEESVQSGQSGYVSGKLNALDLLDAEHVLFEAHTAIARARADYAIRWAELEGEVGMPVPPIVTEERGNP